MTDDNNLNNPFWQFACDFYQIPGISASLIALQDDEALSINFILFIFYLDQQKIHSCENLLPNVKRQCEELEKCLQPLRQSRRELKKQTGFHNEYEQIKNVELKIEQRLIANIYQQSLLDAQPAMPDNSLEQRFNFISNKPYIIAKLLEIDSLSRM